MSRHVVLAESRQRPLPPISHTRPVRGLALVLLLTIIAGCGGHSSNNKKTNVPTQSSKASATPTPQALLDAALKNTDALNAFHFTLTHENGTTPIAQGIAMSKADGDFLKPDRFKANVTGTVLGGFSIQAKVINVGNNTWIDPTGRGFQPLPNGVSASAIL